MAAYLFAVFVFLLCIALAVAGLVIAQRRVPLELRQAHNTTGVCVDELSVAESIAAMGALDLETELLVEGDAGLVVRVDD
jgi:hypothetical protein